MTLHRWLCVGLAATVGLLGCGSKEPEQLTLLEGNMAMLYEEGFRIDVDTSKLVLGADRNENWVRDDVEHYISAMWIKPAKRNAALQWARAMSLALITNTYHAEAMGQSRQILMGAQLCLQRHFPQDDPYENAWEVMEQLQELIINTDNRRLAWSTFDKASSQVVARRMEVFCDEVVSKPKPKPDIQ